MTTTIARPRRKLREPSIREVCLIGDSARRYVHFSIEDGLRTAQDSGTRTQDSEPENGS